MQAMFVVACLYSPKIEYVRLEEICTDDLLRLYILDVL